jgi:putative glycosyltransferase
MYRSSAYLKEFHRRVTATVERLGIISYEIVFVNDGSPDDSLHVAQALFETDRHVVIVDLSRNFGHHKALMVGTEYARGARVFLLDSDLEEDPELLEQLIATMNSTSSDVVFGVQLVRRGGWFERFTGNLYFTLMNAFSGIKFPRNVLTLRLMTRRYVNSLLLHRERELLISGIWHLTGYAQTALPVTKHKINATTYPLHKRIALVITSIIAFSDRPLRAIFYTGIAMVCASLLYIVYILMAYLFNGSGVSGYTSLILSIWLIGGFNFLFLGTIGMYVATIFSETKQRPYAIVRDVLRHDSAT